MNDNSKRPIKTKSLNNVEKGLLEIKREKATLISDYKEKLISLNQEESLLMKDKSLIERSVKSVLQVLQEHPDEALDILYIKKRVYKRTRFKIEFIEPILSEVSKEDNNVKFLSDGRVLYKLSDTFSWFSSYDNPPKFSVNTKMIADYLDVESSIVSKMSRVLERQGYSFYESEHISYHTNSRHRCYSESDVLILEKMKATKEQNPSLKFHEIALDLVLTSDEREKRNLYLNQRIAWDIERTATFMNRDINCDNYFDLVVKIIEIISENNPNKMSEIEKHRYFPSRHISKVKRNIESKSKKDIYLLNCGFYFAKRKTNTIYKNLLKYLLIELDIALEELSPIIKIVHDKKEETKKKLDTREYISPTDEFTDDIILEAGDKIFTLKEDTTRPEGLNGINSLFMNDEEDDLM